MLEQESCSPLLCWVLFLRRFRGLWWRSWAKRAAPTVFVALDSHHLLPSMERLWYFNNQYSLFRACWVEVRPPVAKADITMSHSLGRVLRGRKWKNTPRYIHGKTNKLNVMMGVFETLTPCFSYLIRSQPSVFVRNVIAESEKSQAVKGLRCGQYPEQSFLLSTPWWSFPELEGGKREGKRTGRREIWYLI